jgi:hypothetical protein
MSYVFSRDGIPYLRDGDRLFDESGTEVGRFRGSKVYNAQGRYAATLVNDRLAYRASDSASVSSPFAPSRRGGFGVSRRAGSALNGSEPRFK